MAHTSSVFDCCGRTHPAHATFIILWGLRAFQAQILDQHKFRIVTHSGSDGIRPVSRESRADFSASLQSLPFGNLWRLSVFLQVFPTTCWFSCRLYTRWWSRCRHVAVWQSRPESQPSYTRWGKPAPRRRPDRGRPKRRAEARNRPIRGFRSPDPAQPVDFPAGPGKHLQENRQVPNTYQTSASPMSSSHVVACPRSILSHISPSFAVVLSRSAAAGGGESRTGFPNHPCFEGGIPPI